MISGSEEDEMMDAICYFKQMIILDLLVKKASLNDCFYTTSDQVRHLS